jgi:hypothetical protein
MLLARSHPAIEAKGASVNLRDFQLRWVAAAAAAAALAVPAAAQAQPDDLGGTAQVGDVPAVVQAPNVGTPALNDRIHSPSIGSAAASHPDGGATRFVPGVSDSPNLAASHPDNRAGVRGPNRAAFVATSSGSSSFDWNDAGIGAGAALALMLAATGGVFLRQRRTRLAL